MGTCAIEVGAIGLQDVGKLLLVQDEQVIEALTPYAPQEALTVRVGARSVEWCPQECDACPSRHPCKERAELTVIIANQEPKGCT